MTCSTNECGTGLGSVILPGDPTNNVILSATPAFGGIDVSWTLPSVNPFAIAYVKLYRGLLPDFSAALLIANPGGDVYYDKTQGTQIIQYFYWIQLVSVNGTVGDLIGPASATAKPPIAVVIEQLTGQIDAGTLAESLKGKIDQITLNAQAIVTESQTRVAANNAYSAVLTQVQAGIDSLYSTVQTEITTRRDGDSTLAAAINTVQSSFGTNLASAQQTLQTHIDTVDGKVHDIGALYTVKLTANGLAGGFGLYNDGSTVEAGFDVDTFWVGKTNANKRKPFIISGGVVYIDQAAIADASITLAKINKATIQNLSAVNADMGNINAGQIRFNKPGDASSCLIIDSATQSLLVYNSGVLRVRIGNLT